LACKKAFLRVVPPGYIDFGQKKYILVLGVFMMQWQTGGPRFGVYTLARDVYISNYGS